MESIENKMGGYHMDTEDMNVDLNDLIQDGVIECPYCHKGKTYTYAAKGRESSNCHICRRLVLWDFDRMKAYKAKAKKFVS